MNETPPFLMPVRVESGGLPRRPSTFPTVRPSASKALLDGTAHDTRVTVWTSATGPGQAERIAWEANWHRDPSRRTA